MLAGKHTFWYSRRVFYRYLNGWSILTLVISLIFIGPFVSLFVVASGDAEGLWGHLMDTVAPRYAFNTIVLMLGVGTLSLIFGITTGWVIARFQFPYARVLEWGLLLPCTVPAYIIAYTYTDFLEYAGPVQIFLRDIFG